MKPLVAIVYLLSCLLGCMPWSTPTAVDSDPDYEQVRRIVQSEWTKKFGKLSAESELALRTHTMRETMYVSAACDTVNVDSDSDYIAGCYESATDFISIYSGGSARARELRYAHELIHLLEYHEYIEVQYGPADPASWHADPDLWIGPDSLLSIVTHALDDYSGVQEIVVAEWIARYGFITNGTDTALSTYELDESSADAISRLCKTTDWLVGCWHPGNDHDQILIDQTLSARDRKCTLIHELIHLISYHTDGDSQSDHTDPALWKDLDSNDSLEAVACRRLKHVV